MSCLTIIGGRRSGKTTELIQELLKDPKGMMIVPTVKERNRLIKYRGVPSSKVLVASHLEVLKNRTFNLYVDRVDTVLSCIVNQRVEAVTLDTGEVKVL